MTLVLVEPGDDGVSVLSLEALTFARRLGATLDAPVHAVVVGPDPDSILAALGAQGVAVVHHADDPRLEHYAAAAWAAAVVDAVHAASPRVVLAAASPRGNEILAHVAARLDLPMAANCVRVAPSEGGLLAARQVMGGSALEEVALTTEPALLTMAGHAVDP